MSSGETEDVTSVSEDEECEGHENILEEELQKSLVSPAQTLASVISKGRSTSKITATCGEIFRDISRLPAMGMPGKLVVYGPNAWPVFSSPVNPAVYMAGSELGQGRLFMTSSTNVGGGFTTKQGEGELAILHENILEWVSHCRGGCDELEVLPLEQVKNIKKLNPQKTVIFANKLASVLSKSDQLLEFIKGGGGLVLAFNHNRWCKKHPEVLEEGHSFFQEVGIGVAEGRLFTGHKGTTVKLDEELYANLTTLHIGEWLESCCNTDIQNMGDVVKSLRNNLSNLPHYVIQAHSDQLATMFKRCHEHIGSDMPGPQNQVRNKSKIGAIEMCCLLTNFGMGYTKAPNVGQFPGDIDPPVPLESVDIEIPTTGISEFYPTGFYLPPGGQLRITVLNKKKLPKGWTVRIGAHSDKIYGKSSLTRWPDIVTTQSLTQQTQVKVFSAYGGNIYVRSPETNKTAKLRLEGVVQAPFFDLGDPVALENWGAVRSKASGPWADMNGRHIRITLPSSSIRDLPDAQLVMETWDRVMLAHLELRGLDPSKQKKQWIVYDTQISKGSMHSGYPVMGHMKGPTNPASPTFVLSYKRLTTTGAWGPYHELGHNMQRNLWTWEGTREVTCNIFALHAIDKVAGVAVWELDKFSSPERLRMYKKYFNDGARYEVMKKSAGLGLGFFAHLAHLFGWDTYKAVFAEYEVLPTKEQPRKNQDKIDHWLFRFSKHAHVSIAPIMDFWGLPFTDKATRQVAQLTPFLPEDRMTELDKDRARIIAEKYPGIVTQKPQ